MLSCSTFDDPEGLIAEKEVPSLSTQSTCQYNITQILKENTNLIDSVVDESQRMVATGVVETIIRYVDPSGDPMRVFFLEVDLNIPGLNMEVGTPFNQHGYGLQTIKNQAEEVNATHHQVIAAINGDFIDNQYETLPRPPHGIVHKNGVVIKDVYTHTAEKPQQGLTFFGLDRNKEPIIGGRDDYQAASGELFNATGGGVFLVKNGQIQSQTIHSIHPRTGIGYRTDGTVIMFVVDGRDSKYNTGSTGMKYTEMASVFYALGAENAINLDGGGSSTFVTQTYGINELLVRNLPGNPNNSHRELVNSWLVYRCLYETETIAGTGIAGFQNGSSSTAKFDNPEGIAIDQQGNIFVADRDNNVIRKISSSGDVSTFAGTGIAGFTDGVAGVAKFNSPWKVAVDNQGNVIVADRGNHSIRKITPNGTVSTLAGTTNGYQDGSGNQAKFDQPTDVAVLPNGNIVIADNRNHCIRMIDSSVQVSTIAGTGNGGYVDGAGSQAQFYYPSGIDTDPNGNLFVADRKNHAIRKIDSYHNVSTVAGGNGEGIQNGGIAVAKFDDPYGVAVGQNGKVLVADLDNNVIREINGDYVSTIIGSNGEGYIDGPSTASKMNSPTDVLVNGDEIIFADYGNHLVRKVVKDEE